MPNVPFLLWKRFPLPSFVGWNVAHPPWAATQGPICGASARVAAKRLDCSRWADIQPQKKAAGATSRIDAAQHASQRLIVFGLNVLACEGSAAATRLS